MDKDKRVFVDSNYFVALFNPRDTLHQNAALIAKKLDAGEYRLVISNFIFLEIITVLSQKRGKIAGIAVGEYLRSNPFIELSHIDEILQEKSWHIFQAIKDKDISFVDCSILAMMRVEAISTLLSFDISHFQKLRKDYRFSFFDQ